MIQLSGQKMIPVHGNRNRGRDTMQETKEPMYGVITDCWMLDLLEQPDAYSRIVTTIPCLTEVTVLETEIDGGYCKVRIATGREGYCKRKYVALR